MKIFIIKSIVITVCLMTFVSIIPIQKYEFPNPETRCNKFTGHVEYYSNYFGRWRSAG